MGGAEQGPVDELRRRRRPGADWAEGAGPGLGDQRVGRDPQGGRPRAFLEHGRDPVRHPARAERRRQKRRVAERRPDQPASRVGETGHRVPGSRRRLRHAEPEPAVPGKVLEFDRSDEDGRIETAERVVADVLDAGRVLGAEGLAPHRIADDDPLAAGGEPGDQRPLEVEALLGAPVVARHEASVDGADRVAGTVVADPRGEQEVGAKPAGLDPRRARPAAEAYPPGPEQIVDPDRFERHLRAGPAPLARPDQALGELARRADPERRAAALPLECEGAGGPGAVEVFEVVGVERRDRVGMKDPVALGRGQALEEPPGGGAADGPLGERAGRVEGRHKVGAERLHRGDAGGERAAGERVDAQVGVDLARREAGGRRPGVDRLDLDLLRVEGGIEGRLVPRLGRAAGGEAGYREQAEPDGQPGAPTRSGQASRRAAPASPRSSRGDRSTP